jgi:hypothetical protein
MERGGTNDHCGIRRQRAYRAARAWPPDFCVLRGHSGQTVEKQASSIALADHGDGLNLDQDLRDCEILRRDQRARGNPLLNSSGRIFTNSSPSD